MSDEPNLANQTLANQTTMPQQGDPRKAAIILLSSTVLMLLWRYVGSLEFFLNHLANRWNVANPQSAAAVYSFICSFVLLGLVPACIVRFVFHERLTDYGVRLGIPKYTFRSMLVLVPLFVIGACVTAATSSNLSNELLSNKQLGQTMPLWLHACTLLLMYMGWEFHFRGFLQVGLAGQLGKTNAILIQVMASSLLHIGEPAPETFGAIAGGILWGLLAFRTKSILSGMMQHYALGLAVDWMAAYS